MMQVGKQLSISGHLDHNQLIASRVNGVAIVALLVFVIFAPLIVGSIQERVLTGEGSALRQIVYIVIFSMALYGAQITRSPAALLRLPKSIILMLSWCCLSVLWANNPSISVRRLFLTLIIIWTIFLLSEKAGYVKTVQLVRWVLALVLMANYLAVLTMPSMAIHQAATEEDPSIVGAWCGLLMSKNYAGPVCALTILFFLFDTKRIFWLLQLSVLVASGIFLYKTNSRTSMGILASSAFIVVLYRFYKPSYRWVLCLFLTLGLVLLGLVVNEYWETLVEPFSRPDSLTGRVQIWPVLVRYWQDHWLLGSGFGSFWNVGEPKPISLYTHGWVTGLASGHNGFLDILVQTGLPGLMMAIFAVVLVPLFKFLTYSFFVPARATLLLACIWFCICHNLTESTIFDRDAIVHVFLMLSIALLGIEVRRQ